MFPIICSAIVVVFSVGISIAGLKLKQERALVPGFNLMLLAAVFLWSGEQIRYTVPGLIVLSFLGSRWTLQGFITSLILLALSLLWSGTAFIMLGFYLLFGVLQTSYQKKMLTRIERANHLQPQSTEEVGFGGKVRSLSPIAPPKELSNTAAWWRVGEETTDSRAPFLLEGRHFTALIEPSGAELLIKKNAKKGEKKEALLWLEEGQDAYVIGAPRWEERPELTAKYREQALTPVFRKEQTSDIYIGDQPSEQLQRIARWELTFFTGQAVIAATLLLYRLVA